MSKYCLQCGWDEVPHLSVEARAELWDGIPPHQKEARSKGIPELGAGAIYPIAQQDVEIDDLGKIGDDWPRVYGMDVGWNWTAVVWGAIHPITKTIYLYDCYKRGQAEPPTHASAVKLRGEWIPGVIDPASLSRNQVDGQQLLKIYRDEGLNLTTAANAVETGLLEVWRKLAKGQIKVFKSLAPWWAEYADYHRDKDGDVVKANDHLMDATRYLVMSGLVKAIPKPVPQHDEPALVFEVGTGGHDQSLGWLGS